MKFKDLWDLESALQVLEHPTVDAKLWAEAVEWLLLYGPPELQKVLLDASSNATTAHFPELKPTHFTPDGQPVYKVSTLARSLNISESEVREIIARKGIALDPLHILDDSKSTVH